MWSDSARFHHAAWLAWLLAAMLAALSTRNPFYLALVIAASALVSRSLGRGSEGAEAAPATLSAQQAGHDEAGRGRGLLLRLVVGVTLAVAVLKGFSLHLGSTVLFRLPEEWPVIGGPITLEGLAHAGLDALSLMAVLSVFVAFSAGADYYALLRSVPPFMHQVGLITSIAITFVPQTVNRFAEIREAQALRGHRVRRVGDLLPWIMPLLAGGMERSIDLAEAMEARGFSRPAATAHRLPPVAVQAGIALGLGLTLAGSTMFAFYPALPWLGWVLIVVGLLLAGATLWAVGRGSIRTRYRRSVWHDRDTILTVVALTVGLVILTHRVASPGSLVYDPLSRLRLYVPPFDPVIAVAIFALAVPTVLVKKRVVTES